MGTAAAAEDEPLAAPLGAKGRKRGCAHPAAPASETCSRWAPCERAQSWSLHHDRCRRRDGRRGRAQEAREAVKLAGRAAGPGGGQADRGPRRMRRRGEAAGRPLFSPREGAEAERGKKGSAPEAASPLPWAPGSDRLSARWRRRHGGRSDEAKTTPAREKRAPRQKGARARQVVSRGALTAGRALAALACSSPGRSPPPAAALRHRRRCSLSGLLRAPQQRSPSHLSAACQLPGHQPAARHPPPPPTAPGPSAPKARPPAHSGGSRLQPATAAHHGPVPPTDARRNCLPCAPLPLSGTDIDPCGTRPRR